MNLFLNSLSYNIFLSIFGDIYWEPIALERYHLGLEYKTRFYIKKVNFYLPITEHNIFIVA